MRGGVSGKHFNARIVFANTAVYMAFCIHNDSKKRVMEAIRRHGITQLCVEDYTIAGTAANGRKENAPFYCSAMLLMAMSVLQ